MRFLDHLSEAGRRRLLALSRPLALREGQYLMRRGDRGGDLYLVESGALEVIEPRSNPEVVLSVVGPDMVVGEMAFLDQAPRTADVRAAGDTALRAWDSAALQRELQSDPSLAAEVYRAIAEIATRRVRDLTIAAISGGLKREERQSVDEGVLRQAHALVEPTRTRWISDELRVRANPGDEDARADMRAAFEDLLLRAQDWLGGLGSPEMELRAGEALARELHPFLTRAQTASRALESVARQSGDPRLYAHILLGEARGDGALGEVLDEVLLRLPTPDGVRRRTSIAGQTLLAALPHQPVRLMVVNAVCGALLARIMPTLGRYGAAVTCVDGSREALSFLDAGLPSRPSAVSLRLVQDDLALLSMGRSQVHHPPQDFILIDALVDYLPDRLVAALMGWCARQLRPGGRVLLTGLAPWSDGPFFHHVVRWPMIRRPGRELRSLVEAGGLIGAVVAGGEREPAVVVTGTKPLPQSGDASRPENA